MNKLHDRLLEMVGAYAWWHKSRYSSLYNWLIFVLVVLNVAFALSADIGKDAYSDLSGYQVANPRATAGNLLDGKKIGEAADRILVKFSSNANASKRQDIYKRQSLMEKSEMAQIGVKLLKISENDTPEEVVQRMKTQEKDSIEFVEVDALVGPSLIPNDPYYTSQWHLPKVSAPTAWDTTTGSQSVIVAICDTGEDPTHPDLAAAYVPGWNFFDNSADTHDVYGHGTTVAGTAAAIGNNAKGVSGIAPNVKIMPNRMSDAAGYAYTSTATSCINWSADHGARVVNLSYMFWDSSAVQTAAKYMQSKGGVTTISAGNNSTSYPSATSQYAVAVSATDSADNRASWSNYGTMISVAAPGVGIYSTANGGGYRSASGTSFSAPATAGVAAMIISANPTLTGAQVKNVLEQSADDLGTPGYDPIYGWGRVNVAKAVAMAGNPPPIVTPPPTPTPSATPVPTPVPGSVAITSFSVSNKTATSATITWTTDVASTGTVGYGLSRTNLSLSAADTNSSTSHSIVLSGLNKKSTYYYKIMAVNPVSGKSAATLVSSFKTLTR